MTTDDYYMEKFGKVPSPKKQSELAWFQISKMLDDYHQQQLKILTIPAVIKSVCSCGRREINVLSGICDMCWNEKFPDEQTVL